MKKRLLILILALGLTGWAPPSQACKKGVSAGGARVTASKKGGAQVRKRTKVVKRTSRKGTRHRNAKKRFRKAAAPVATAPAQDASAEAGL